MLMGCDGFSKKIVNIDIPSSVTDIGQLFNGVTLFGGTITIRNGDYTTDTNGYNPADMMISAVTDSLVIRVPENSATHASIETLYGSMENVTIETFTPEV